MRLTPKSMSWMLPLLMVAPMAVAQQVDAAAAARLVEAADHPDPAPPRPCCILHPFTAPPDGNSPEAGLVMDAKGVLYGTTYNGGSSITQGQGIVFSLTSPSKGSPQIEEKILHVFSSDNDLDGSNPMGGVILGEKGELYGTTEFGGPQNIGTVYRLTPPASKGGKWKEDILYSFGTDEAADGANPLGSLLLYKGNLYGTTSMGGGSGCEEQGCGNVFELSPTSASATEWKETILYQFSDADGGLSFATLVADEKGNLYGTTSINGPDGGGAVFELSPPAKAGKNWKLTVLHSFHGGDGANPQAGVIFDDEGALYGTTFNGGPYDVGVVFRLSPPAKAGGTWKETVLHGFTLPLDEHGMLCYTCGNAGANPSAGLAIGKNKVVYGTTAWGGDNLAGEVFRLEPPAKASGDWAETVLHSFTGKVLVPAGADNGDGINPYGALLLENGLLYGTVQSGGAFNYGDVFSLTP